jgi:hypothetical protein
MDAERREETHPPLSFLSGSAFKEIMILKSMFREKGG